MSKAWVSSDWHLGHTNIIKYCPESRGHFTDVADMNAGIIRDMNSVISEDDTLYILGDVAFCKPAEAVELLKQVNGKKVIIWGNHDKKLRESPEFEYNKGLMGIIHTADYLEIKHKFDGKNYDICMMHFPIWSHHRQHHGSLQFHGHCHSSFEKRNTFGEYRRVMDIGCDGNMMMPHSIDDLCSDMSRRDFKYEGHHDGSR